MKKFTQLDIKQRAKLQVLLKEKKSLSEVAKILEISRQTVYREILRNSYQVKQDTYGCKSSCIHFLDCRKQLIVLQPVFVILIVLNMSQVDKIV